MHCLEVEGYFLWTESDLFVLLGVQSGLPQICTILRDALRNDIRNCEVGLLCAMPKICRFTFIITGDLVQLGGSTVFRFNHPQEADRMRRRQSVSQRLERVHNC